MGQTVYKKGDKIWGYSQDCLDADEYNSEQEGWKLLTVDWLDDKNPMRVGVKEGINGFSALAKWGGDIYFPEDNELFKILYGLE